jgi:hypothetical protein
VEDPTTIALNLTFFATLGIAVVMFVGVLIAFVATLLLAGLGRLVATAGTVLFRRRTPALMSVSQAPESATSEPAQPAREEPRLSREWPSQKAERKAS